MPFRGWPLFALVPSAIIASKLFHLLYRLLIHIGAQVAFMQHRIHSIHEQRQIKFVHPEVDELTDRDHLEWLYENSRSD